MGAKAWFGFLGKRLFAAAARYWRTSIWLVVLSGGAFFIRSGFQYWVSHKVISWQECAFGRAECSAAAATWSLAAFALLSAALALEAVVWAVRTYRVEVAPRLGQAHCPKHNPDSHPAHKEVFLTSEGLILQLRPAGFEIATASDYYYIYDAAFTNLGRTALADVKVDMYLRDANGDLSPPIEVKLGNIRCDDEIHVTFYSSKDFAVLDVAWHFATQEGIEIPFYPEHPLTQFTVRPLNLLPPNGGQENTPLPGFNDSVDGKEPQPPAA